MPKLNMLVPYFRQTAEMELGSKKAQMMKDRERWIQAGRKDVKRKRRNQKAARSKEIYRGKVQEETAMPKKGLKAKHQPTET